MYIAKNNNIYNQTILFFMLLLVAGAKAATTVGVRGTRHLSPNAQDPSLYFPSNHPCYQDQCGTTLLSNGNYRWFWYDEDNQLYYHVDIDPTRDIENNEDEIVIPEPTPEEQEEVEEELH